ncbi:MAG: DUF2959 family protein [Gammaproteobacteria bacterium]
MNTQKLIPNLFTFATLTAAALLAGCGTTSGYKQADKTGEGIAEFREEIVNGKKAIDGTMKSLDQIAASATTDPRKAFEKFSKGVSNLESTAGKVRDRGQDMKAQGKVYFAQWEKQMAELKNEEIRSLAASRKAKLQETFEAIAKAAEPLKAQFSPWMSDLKDLEKFLGNDLTIAGVDAAKGLFAKTRSSGLEVQKSMDALIAELNSVAATITPAKTAAK